MENRVVMTDLRGARLYAIDEFRHREAAYL
jgi:hypothetical protein